MYGFLEQAVRPGRWNKAVRLIKEYDLEELGAELEQLWTADEDCRSPRALANYFNRHLLEAALDSAGVHIWTAKSRTHIDC